MFITTCKYSNLFCYIPFKSQWSMKRKFEKETQTLFIQNLLKAFPSIIKSVQLSSIHWNTLKTLHLIKTFIVSIETVDWLVYWFDLLWLRHFGSIDEEKKSFWWFHSLNASILCLTPKTVMKNGKLEAIKFLRDYSQSFRASSTSYKICLHNPNPQ